MNLRNMNYIKNGKGGIQLIRTQEGNNDSSHAVGGGAATQTGIDYQNRVAAWVAVSILAEQNASLPFDLPADITFEYFRCETEQPVDDILIGTSNNGLLFMQVKHTINLEKGSASGLASTMKQFVRQFLAYKNESSGRLFDRPLNDTTDRLILATAMGSSKSIRESLKAVLDRVRILMPGQTLDDAAKNKDEKEALTVVIDHISNAWIKESGVQATLSDIQSILRLIWVISLDLDPEGSTEIEAKNLLRSTILQNPAEADAAWSILVQASANYARNRSGGDRSLLQKQLLNKGIDIKCISSYLGDIQCLKQFSGSTFNQLTDFSKISIGKTEVKIKRKSTMSLRSVVENGSIVIVGEPGAGKSGALHDLVSDLFSDQFDVVFIAVDRIEATSQSSLRNEIGISHELIDVLKNWVGVKPAFLVIDALDAARTDLAIQTFRNIISTMIKLESRWNVVVSIRKFDLRYNRQLRDLFSGTPPTEFRDKEFNMIYHINIPKLDDEELKQIEIQSKDLANLVLNSSSQLNELLRSPFNLRLMGDLLGLKVPVKELSPINTQTELLDRYWIERIIREDAYGDAREIVLRKICQGLVKLRSLKINRLEIIEPSNSDIIKDLLSSQVIVEWQASSESIPERYIIAFSHNVIYDYAVSRLLLRVPLNDFINILTQDPELLLAIRPSIVYHFKYIWTLDTPHQLFWACVNSVICSKDIPEIGKLLGPSVASELATKIEDFEQLFRILEDSDEMAQQNAEKACNHVIGALLSLPPNSKFFVGDESGPWAQFLLRLSDSIRHSTAYIIRQLLISLCEYHDKFTEEQAACIGISARRLLTFALESADRDQWLINHAIQAVCRTFYSDVRESNGIIRRLLEPEHMKLYAAEEMHWLAREIKNLISIDPDLVEDVYKAAFTFNENSEEKTQIGGSRIIPMSSTRKQDYSMVRYELVNTFSDFIRMAPVNAIRALIVAINGYVIEEHSSTEEMIAISFEFDGLPTKIKTDYSTIWDDGGAYHHDNALKMLDSFEQYLLDTTQKSTTSDIRKEIISIIARENYSAVIWKRLLKCGIKEPNTIGQEIKSLIWAKPIFNCIDTGVLAGDLIKAIFENLTRQEKELVEKAILSITEDSASDSQTQFKEKTRNRLLGCIPDSLIVSEQVRQIIDELKASNAIPPNEPHFRFSSGWSGEPYDEEKYLADEGVPVLEEANKIIRDIEKPVDDFSKKYLNSAPSREAIQSIFPAIRQLYKALFKIILEQRLKELAMFQSV